MRKFWIGLPLVVLLGLFGVSCGGDDEPAVSTEAVSDNPYGGIDVPPPDPDEPILAVVRAGEGLTLSLDDLRGYELVEETVFEPFVKQEITFVGVPMAALFDAAGIEPTDEVITVALNEYVYTNLASEFTGTDAFVAFEQDGGAIPMDRGGPLRIIVPNDRPLTGSLEVWNWSLAEIRVE